MLIFMWPLAAALLCCVVVCLVLLCVSKLPSLDGAARVRRVPLRRRALLLARRKPPRPPR